MKSKKFFIVFPNQLFENIEILKEYDKVYLIEEFLFFKQYKFHKQKLVFHRATMKCYCDYLTSNKIKVEYIESVHNNSDIRNFLKQIKCNAIGIYEPADYWLNKRIKTFANSFKIIEYDNPLYINNLKDLDDYFGTKKKYFQTDFYIYQRKQRNILIENDDKPLGGKWSFDAENRLKYPKDKIPPKVNFVTSNSYYEEAVKYIEKNFSKNYGEINTNFLYPVNFADTLKWLNNFFTQRFAEFGEYEDAIVDKEIVLHHSVLTPMLNIGLITPMAVIKAAIKYAHKNEIGINSLEGFIRQILGWREFIRGVYHFKGREERIKNYWKFNKTIPNSFYTATTGIKPIDDTIKKVLQTGYCHHIERLMILGNFMLLCNFHPNEVYKWFMEMFIDAYDWVMVPNVYGMSQFADGGLMATKPYISGSSYVLKMSNYKKNNEWCDIWDSLFWNFMHKHRDFFLKNPRLGMLIKTFDKMDKQKQNNLITKAEKFIKSL